MKSLDSRHGFTLLELLMAIMIGALLMVAASTFVFSMGELWGRGGEERLFDRQDVDRVRLYLPRPEGRAVLEIDDLRLE